MKTLLAASLCVAVASGAFAVTHGAWTATPQDDGEVNLSISRSAFQHMGVSFAPRELGLDPAVLRATVSTPVTMRLQRDAGTVVLEGTFKDGFGAGQLTFTPNRSYVDAVRSMGLDFEIPEDKTEEDQLFMAAAMDVSLAYLRTMHPLFPSATWRDLRRARGVDVTPAAIADLRAAGIRSDDLHEISSMVAVGVTGDYIRALRAAGVEIHDAHEAKRLKAVDVTPQFVAELAAAGYKNLSTRDLVRLKATGVDSDFIRKMSNIAKEKK